MGAFSRSLREAAAGGRIPVVPDIKCVSPKEGDLLRGRDPVSMARLLVSAGAPALSVVTEERRFGGSLRLLQEIAAAVSVPVLRKDFVTAASDLAQTRESGATAVLLICACLPRPALRALYEEALRCGLEPLVEAHTREELEFAAALGAGLVGINNREIRRLEKDDGTVLRTQRLMPFAPRDALIVSESGIETPRQARQALRAGAGAVLVGTAIWKADDTARFYKELCAGEDGV